MKTLKILLPILIVLAFVMTACSSPATAPMQEEAAFDYAEAEMAAPSSADSPAAEFASGGSSVTGDIPAAKRLVIRNANLSLVVVDPNQAMGDIARMAEEMGGYVVSSQLYKTTTRNGSEIPQADISLRIPAEKLTDAMNQIKGLVKNARTDVLSENISGQDVTKEYTDLKSRLANLEAAEKQLQEIMNDARKTEDVLDVYENLVEVRGQIEVIKGQIQYYEESAAMSSISVRLQAEESVKPIEIGGWKPIGVAKDALQALIDAFQFIANSLIWLVIFVLPILLILVLIFLALRAIFRKVFKPKPRQPKTQQPNPPSPPETPQS